MQGSQQTLKSLQMHQEFRWIVSHQFIGRATSLLSWLTNEDEIRASDSSAFGIMGSFLPHDTDCGQLLSPALGGAVALHAGRCPALDSASSQRQTATSPPPAALAVDGRA